MEFIKAVNALISFVVELVMLWLLALGGYNLFRNEQIGRWLAAILLPAIVIGLWGYYLAPKSTHRLAQPWVCIVQLILFSITAAVSYRFINHTLTALFIVLSFGSSIFALRIKQ